MALTQIGVSPKLSHTSHAIAGTRARLISTKATRILAFVSSGARLLSRRRLLAVRLEFFDDDVHLRVT
jgi:hypothetical protein